MTTEKPLKDCNLQELKERAAGLGFENLNVFTSKVQVITIIESQLKKVKKALSPTTFSKGDNTNYKSKKARMKAFLESQPKVQVFVPLEGKEKPGKAFLPVTLNGVRTDVPKGIPTMQSTPVAEVVYAHLQLTAVAGQEFLLSRDDKVKNLLS